MITEVRHFDQGVEQARSFETPMLEKEALGTWFQQVLRIVHDSGFQFERVEYHFFTADGQRWLDPEEDTLYSQGSEIRDNFKRGFFRGDFIIRALELRTGPEAKRATGAAYGKPLGDVFEKAKELWPTDNAWSKYHQGLRAQVARVLVKFVVAQEDSEPLPLC